MARQKAGYHPQSFAVWYEHVSGSNNLLSEELGQLQQKGILLTDEMTETLYSKYVSDCDADATQRVHDELEKILRNIVASTREAGEHSSRFDHSLERYSVQLEEKPEVESLQGVVRALLTETRSMRSSLSSLERELSEKTREMEGLKEQLRLVREETIIDALTGLVNRKVFLERFGLARHVPDAYGNLCLLLADIDHFKTINDNYGHLLGDKVIRQVAQTMNATVKGGDTAARYGGEEFAILLPNTSIENARKLAEQIRLKVERIRVRRADNGSTLGVVTLSIGIACFRPGDDADSMIHRADMALYAAKNNGRNQVMIEAE
ncbi:MAG: GGDEF domain-containing protein [Gammaproteobacteria bacterium]|nr:GGDEF domain-containing protein [Gammaproteobacteria bacterium]